MSRSWSFRLGLATVVLIPVAAVSGAAFAAPTPTITQLNAQLEAAQTEAEAAAEKFNAVRTQLQSIQVRVDAAKTRQGAQQKQVDAARHALGVIAAERYREGDLAGLNLLLSNNPDALLAQSGLVSTLGNREAAAIQRLVDAQHELEKDDADLFAQADRLQKAQAELGAAKNAADAKAASIKAQRNSLSATQRRAVDQYAASRGGDRPGLTCAQANIPAVSARVQAVIDYACSQLGKPYQWGADGPSTFDCSGLTMMAWAQSGVSLPHLASAQYSDGKHIPLSSVQPGDLVFRGGLGHVGLAIGNGLMIHAPHTGTVVQISAISSGMLAARY
ncbi:MAG TPA: C40 family peptidase [Kineosporiaceae bacterium]|nr:C40 family peptidase [Kineosporiaceae bacterium]